ncbi:hypothetical protein E8E11_004601 [Didymella keratinophila]|nr:hypothetical protein E8E11_004601 [Didymella keratinophila]
MAPRAHNKYTIRDSEDDSESSRANSQATMERAYTDLDPDENESGNGAAGGYDDDDDAEDDEEEQDGDNSSPLDRADDLLDDDGDIVEISRGEEMLQEKLDHLRYAELVTNFKKPDGWVPLTDATYEHEVQARSSIARETSEHAWTRAADDVVATMHPEVLKAITKLDEARELADHATFYANSNDPRWQDAYKIDAKSLAKKWT